MKKKHSRITARLIRRFFSIYSIIFTLMAVLILTIAMIFSIYQIRQQTIAKTTLVSSTISDYWKSIQEKSYYLASLDDLKDYLREYKKNPSPEFYEKINISLSNFQSLDSTLFFVMLEDSNGNTFHSINDYQSGIIDAVQSEESYQRAAQNHSTCLSPIQNNNYTSDPAFFCSYITSHSINGEDYLITLCYSAQTLLLNIQAGSQGLDHLEIFDAQKNCLYHSGKETESSTLPDFVNNSTRMSEGKLGLHGYQHFQIDNFFSLYTIGSVSASHLLTNISVVLLALCFLYFVPLLIVLLSVIPVNDHILQPMVQLTKEISEFSLGQNPIHIHETNDEIEDLSRSFQTMCININNQADELTKKEHEKAVTYYKLLTTQLDPHFIYNTMNIINILARQEAYGDIIRVNTALTRVLRERLNTQNTTFETIENELLALKQYQIIMDYRYHNQVSVDYDVDSSLMQYKIPKNILQPMMENSYYHGLAKEDGSVTGNIELIIYSMDNEIIIEISDNGQGISEEALTVIRTRLKEENSLPGDRAHIGLSNIYHRIQYLYGDSFSMNVESQGTGHGTTIIITLPII